jgi:hypothetical protein
MFPMISVPLVPIPHYLDIHMMKQRLLNYLAFKYFRFNCIWREEICLLHSWPYHLSVPEEKRFVCSTAKLTIWAFLKRRDLSAPQLNLPFERSWREEICLLHSWTYHLSVPEEKRFVCSTAELTIWAFLKRRDLSAPHLNLPFERSWREEICLLHSWASLIVCHFG